MLGAAVESNWRDARCVCVLQLCCSYVAPLLQLLQSSEYAGAEVMLGAAVESNARDARCVCVCVCVCVYVFVCVCVFDIGISSLNGLC